jgi:hypothetical protein
LQRAWSTWSLWKRLVVIVAAVSVAVAGIGLYATFGEPEAPAPSSPGERSASPSQARVTSCEFADGWLEASGTYVRAAGTDEFEEVNVLVSGVFVVRAAFYDEPIGVTQYWHVSEPDVARGPCTAVVT